MITAFNLAGTMQACLLCVFILTTNYMPPSNYIDLEGMFQTPKLCLEKLLYVPVSKIFLYFISC